MTTAKNTLIKEIARKSLFDDCSDLLGSSTTFKQGDMLAINTSTHVLYPTSATGDTDTFAGIAPVSVTNGKIVGPYDGLTAVDAAEGNDATPGPMYGVVCEVTIKTGDNLSPESPVYLGNALDAQTVTATQPGSKKAVGLYQGPAITNAAAGTKINVLFGALYPDNTLKF